MPGLRARGALARGIGRDRWNVVESAINVTLGTDAELVLVDAAGGARTVTLMAAAALENDLVIVKRMNAAGGNVIVDGAGAETIDGAATVTLTAQFETVVLATDGEAWHVVARG